MLTLLKIKNLALVEELTWELGRGLVCVTGETGAGKSIIVGALKLVLGERADRGLIRSGEESCTVEAVFDLQKPDEVNGVLEEAGLDHCEDNQLVIRRVIGASGGNKQFINCSPSTLTVLKSLGQYLVDLHGPHDHQSLLSQERQLDMLDAYAGSDRDAEAYRLKYREWRNALRDFEKLSQSERANEQEIDLLKYQINEIEEADFKDGEEADLESRYKVSSNSTHLLELSQKVLYELGDADDSVLSRLSDIARSVRELERIDSGIANSTGGFDSAQVELQELDSSLRDYVEGLEFDPKEIASIEERINLLETLKRKYGSHLEEIHEFRDEASAKLAKIEGRSDELERLQKSIKTTRKAADTTAMKLSQKRRKAAPKLAKEIGAHLMELGFKRAKIDILLEPLDEPGGGGIEQADFSFAPNPGEPNKPLRLIASSGEMSRVMLAVKSALAKQDSIPLLVFDEIDANVGGEIAQAVGAKMASLGASHQVISITHLPQVAALASCHYFVSKEFGKDRTRTVMKRVENEERVTEIARMLGGKEASARAHAESLLAAN